MRSSRSRSLAVVSMLNVLAVASCRSVPAKTDAPPAAVPAPQPAAQPNVPRPPERARLEPQPIPAPVLLPLPRAQFRAAVDSMVNDPQWKNAHWGILIVDPERGDTLYSHNADKLFMPASNQKIVTGAVGLTQLGAEYQWRTAVELRGTKKGATFTGDIVLHGRGDPSWSDAMRGGKASSALAPIADALNKRGITRVVGNIVAEGDAFSDAIYGFGWAFDDFDFGYSAPVDELFFNEGFFTLKVKAGQQNGKLLSVASSPLKDYPRVVVRAVARERSDTSGGNRALEATWDSTASTVIVTGTLPMGDSSSIELSYRHPNDAAIAALREVLAERKIVVAAPKRAGPVRDKPKAPQASAGFEQVFVKPVATRAMDTLVVLASPPLRDVLKRLEKPSQNQMAEILYKTAALEKTGFGRADSARALVQRQLVEWGVAPEAIAVRDGSGLSRHDYVAPRALVQILDKMRRSPLFDVFYAALPIAGVDGTVASRMRNTAAANNVHAKTGTLDKARSLSGYVTTADGQMLVFSFLCNNFTVSTRNVERVQDAISVRLANARLAEWR